MRPATLTLALLTGCASFFGPSYTVDDAKADLAVAWSVLELRHEQGEISDSDWTLYQTAYTAGVALLDQWTPDGGVTLRDVLREIVAGWVAIERAGVASGP